MPLVEVLKIAGGIATVLSFGAFVIALFVWWFKEGKEKSIADAVIAQGYDAKDIREILANFTDDESRLQALGRLLGNQAKQNKAVVEKLKSNIDPIVAAAGAARSTNKRLLTAGAVLLAIAVVTLFAHYRLSIDAPLSPPSAATSASPESAKMLDAWLSPGGIPSTYRIRILQTWLNKNYPTLNIAAAELAGLRDPLGLSEPIRRKALADASLMA
ncbi:MAG: hypothetical protein Q8L22_29950, partial [Reyranella sp.]|nr:hypothetical protein [Reyranella sp.]